MKFGMHVEVDGHGHETFIGRNSSIFRVLPSPPFIVGTDR